MDVYLAGGIFLVAYALIASERWDRTLVALLGAMLVIVLGIVDQQEAFAAIDFNVIFLLVGMMIMAGALRKTGFFEFVAGHAIRLSRGEPFRLLVSLTVFTAVLSAFLDNVTTVVLITPITLAVTRALRVNPFPYLLSMMSSPRTSAGRRPLIGDDRPTPGSAANLSFVDFLGNLAPVVSLILLAYVVMIRVVLLPPQWTRDSDRLEALALVDPAAAIKDRPMMIRSLLILALTMIGFLLHSRSAWRSRRSRCWGRRRPDARGRDQAPRGLRGRRVEHPLVASSSTCSS